MPYPKKPINEINIFSSLSNTAKQIISELLEHNEKLKQENQQFQENQQLRDRDKVANINQDKCLASKKSQQNELNQEKTTKYIFNASPRLIYWSKLLGKFISVQLVVQALGAASGIIIIRTLGKEEYANFTIANSLQGTMNLLADSGISTGLIAIGGRVWQDPFKLGQLVNTTLKLRIYFLVVAVMLITPILLWMLVNNGSSFMYAVLIAITILVELYFYIINGVSTTVLRLHSDIKNLQYSDLLFSTSRIILLGLASYSLLNVLVATFISTISSALQSFLLNKSIKNKIVVNAPVSMEYRKSILEITTNLLPSTIYYCIQGQLSVFLISIFGNTNNIAEVGALGRFSIIFSLINAVASQIFIPRFSRCESKFLMRQYLQIIGGYSSICLIIIGLTFLFPEQILWIIGKNYSNLKFELTLMVISAVIYSITGVMWAINTSRAWVKYNWVYIPSTLITQAFFLFKLDLSKVSEVIYLGIFSILPFLAINIISTFIGINSKNIPNIDLSKY